MANQSKVPDKQFAEEIQKWIRENRRTFKDQSSRIISDYQGEESLTSAYDGRQILEMLQNADDAGATDVLINLDKKLHCLTIANKGNPFTAEGIGSLMIRDLSTKRGKEKMIGNKGLGFRSVLSWATKITIYTQGYSVVFSPEIAQREFEFAIPDKLKRQDFLKKHNYNSNAIPFPFLGIPDVNELKSRDNKWDTIIEISYNPEVEQAIRKQLSQFKKEILIFLNHIEILTIKTPEETHLLEATKKELEGYIYEKRKILIKSVSIEGKTWRVFNTGGKLPDIYQQKNAVQPEHFNVRIAVTDSLDDTFFKIFTFFPTQLSLYMPCLIHGTFELEPSRNHLTSSERNTYIFSELQVLLISIALRLSDEAKNWSAYRLLSPVNETSDSDKVKAFYTSLKAKKIELAIFPCVDGKYRVYKEIVFHSQDFSKFILKNRFEGYFRSNILPLDDVLQTDPILVENSLVFKREYLQEKVNQVGLLIKDNTIRVELIKILSQKEFRTADKKALYSLLTNSKGEIIPSSSIAFTPATSSGKSFPRPSYADFDFIKEPLYDALLNIFDIQKTSTAPRDLQRVLNSILNIQPYEPAPIITSYISKAKEKIKSTKIGLARAIVIEMVQCLYIVRQAIQGKVTQDNARIEEQISGGIPLISRKRNIVPNTSLVFGKEYTDGKLTEEIFTEIYGSDDYLASPLTWGIKNASSEDLQRFFEWLKVGNFSQMEDWKETGNEYWQGEYIKYIFSIQQRPLDYTSASAQGRRVKSMDSILKKIGKGISVEQFLVWIMKDKKVMRSLDFSEDKVFHSYGQRYHTINANHSYVRWQFLNSKFFENYVIEERHQHRINPIHIDFDFPLFKRNGINHRDIERVLVLLGAKQSFDELPVTRVFKILDDLVKEDENGDSTMSIYRLAIKNFSQPSHREEAIKHIKPKLFARQGSKKEFREPNSIYYGDNQTLPAKIIDSKWMLNLPRRAGEQQVKDFFGVNTLESLQPRINESSVVVSKELQIALSAYIDKAKVFILAYRIEALKNPADKRDAANQLNNLELLLVSQCNYSIGTTNSESLDEGEFINVGRKFYFKIPSGITSFSELENNRKFRDAFAEILCILFKVTDLKTVFRNILTNGLDETKYQIETDNKTSLLKEASQLCSVDLNELSFWRRVFAFLSKDLPEPRGGADKFLKLIQESLRLKSIANYREIDFENFGSQASIDLARLLNRKFRIHVNILMPQGMAIFHMNRFSELFEHYERCYAFKLWKSLTPDIKLQKQFLKKRRSYDLIKEKVAKIANAKLYNISVDYDAVIRNEIEFFTGIHLKKNEDTNETIKLCYPELRNQFDLEWPDLPLELESLAYYEGNSERLRMELLKIRKRDEKPKVQERDGGSTNIEIAKAINFVKLEKSQSPVLPVNTKGGGTRWTFDPRISNRQRQAGKAAEKLVGDSLVNEYGRANVKWVSGNSDEDTIDDTCGYDIKYRVEGKWKMLEVKSAPTDTFIISGSEVRVGIQNKKQYHLALVKDGVINIVTDFFLNQDWTKDFQITGAYQAIPKDWLVGYRIKP